jgi:hypothetical protein
MPAFKTTAAARLLPVLCLLPGFSPPAMAQSWSTPLLGRELVIVEKTVSGDLSAARSLPEVLREKLGQDFVEYESFVAARLPAGAAKELTAAALREGRGVFHDTRPPAVLNDDPFIQDHLRMRSRRDRGVARAAVIQVFRAAGLWGGTGRGGETPRRACTRWTWW